MNAILRALRQLGTWTGIEWGMEDGRWYTREAIRGAYRRPAG